MRVGGIRGVGPRPAQHEDHVGETRTAPRHPDLVQRGWDGTDRPNQLWVADFSYVWTLTGFVYVAFVVDVFSRRILGWRVSTSKAHRWSRDALHQALHARRRGEHDWGTAADWSITRTPARSTRRWRSPPSCSTPGSRARSAPSATPSTTRCASPRSGCSRPRPSTTADPPGPTAAPSNGRSPAGSTGTTHDRLHSSIGHLPPVEFEHETGRLQRPPTRRSRKQPALREIQGVRPRCRSFQVGRCAGGGWWSGRSRWRVADPGEQVVQAVSQGQAAGRCRVMRRAEDGDPGRDGDQLAADRARWSPWPVAAPARVAAARVRLNAITASTSQAALAVNLPRAGAPGRSSSGRRGPAR